MMSDVKPPRHGGRPPQLEKSSTSVNTWTAMMFAFFATPENGTLAAAPLPAAIPATCVPW